MKTARIVCLSKQPTSTPDVGQVRTISVLPIISKVYEKVIHKRLLAEIEEKGGLNKN